MDQKKITLEDFRQVALKHNELDAAGQQLQSGAEADLAALRRLLADPDRGFGACLAALHQALSAAVEAYNHTVQRPERRLDVDTAGDNLVIRPHQGGWPTFTVVGTCEPDAGWGEVEFSVGSSHETIRGVLARAVAHQGELWWQASHAGRAASPTEPDELQPDLSQVGLGLLLEFVNELVAPK